MTKPISDKAEVALEYPDKLHIGTFEHSSRFAASVDSTGIALVLERPGAEDVRKSVHMHINFGLFADIGTLDLGVPVLVPRMRRQASRDRRPPCSSSPVETNQLSVHSRG
jgi:hypothetical protein